MIRVQREDFDAGGELSRIRAGKTGAGAVVSFTGAVRGEADGERLAALTIEHYPGMTEIELARVESEARTRWPVSDVLVIHRHGRLAPGENIVLVVTASAHRDAAFEAAKFLMDYLKTRAPFWKKETFASGRERWVDAARADDLAARAWEN